MTDPVAAGLAAYQQYMDWQRREDPFCREEPSSYYSREAVKKAIEAALKAAARSPAPAQSPQREPWRQTWCTQNGVNKDVAHCTGNSATCECGSMQYSLRQREREGR